MSRIDSGGGGVDISSVNQDRVQAKINSLNEQLSGLIADLQSLINELQALDPPQDPGADASDEAKQAFATKMQNYQQKVSALNRRIAGVYKRISQCERDLAQANAEYGPAVQRDTRENQKKMEAERERMEAMMQTVSTDETADTNEDNKVEIHVQRKKVDKGLTAPQMAITMSDSTLSSLLGSGFKLDPDTTVVNANPTTDNKYTASPPAGGSGLPPIEGP